MDPLPADIKEVMFNPDGSIKAVFCDSVHIEHVNVHDDVQAGVIFDEVCHAEATSLETCDYYKSVIKLATERELLYINFGGELRHMRLFTIAAKDIFASEIVCQIDVDDELKLKDGSDVLCAVLVLQSIGVSAVVINAQSCDILVQATERISPYTKCKVCAKLSSDDLKNTSQPPLNVQMLMPKDINDIDLFRETIKGFKNLADENCIKDAIIACDNKQAHFIEPEIFVSDAILCTMRFAEDILEAEDSESGAIKVLIENEENLANLDEFQYMIDRPVCICSEDGELLDKALRVFKGRAIYDGTWEIPDNLLKYFEYRYGLIIL